jgi:tetratricopeptide (TPR) repeat protein
MRNFASPMNCVPHICAASSRLCGLSSRSIDARRARTLLLLATLFALPLHAQLPAGTRSADSAVGTSPLSQAEDAIAAQHFDEAKKLLLVITAADPKDARSLYDLGYTDEALNDNVAAEAAYRAAIAADPKNFEAHAALGIQLEHRDPTESRKELAIAVELTPAANAAEAKARVLRKLAEIDTWDAAAANPSAASNELLAAIKLTSETPQDTFLTAQIAEKLGDLSDAEAAYRRALAADTTNFETLFDLSSVLIRENKLSNAKAILVPALQTAQPDGERLLVTQLARVYMLQGEDAKAVPLLEAQHKQYPGDPTLTRMLADVYSQTGDAPQADVLYQQLLAASPHDIELLSARGDTLIRQKKFIEAEDLLQKADALFLANPAALPSADDRVQLTGSLAFAASSNDQPTLVLTALDQRAHYAPETPATLFLRATAHDHLHHVPQARSFYTQFIAAAGDKYPNETWEAKHRLIALKTDK